jgi:23S rRNA pseudouridine1911/1915/1917 synthase
MANDVIKLSSRATQDFWEIPVVYEDEHLLALNKPPLLLTSPDRYDPERPNLMKLLHRDIERGAPWAKEKMITYLANAHRLDFETSGVILLTKSKPVLVAVANLFGSEKPLKTYAALVEGTPAQDMFTIDVALTPNLLKLGQMKVDTKNGKRSTTMFQSREKFRGYTLMECRPLTGRTHQIRVHLKYARHPIVGDAVYGGGQLLLSHLKPEYRLKGNKTERPLIATTALHAEKLELIHPITGMQVVMTAEWPKDFAVAVKYLRKYAA